MTLTAAQCIADMKLAAGTSPEGFVPIDAINSVGVIVSGLHAWKWRERFGRLNSRAAIAVSDATWEESSKTLTKAGAFASYAFLAGDEVQITGGADATLGFYKIANRVDADAITLETSIGSAADTDADIDFTVLTPALALPSDFEALIDDPRSTATGQSIAMVPHDRLQLLRVAEDAWGDYGSIVYAHLAAGGAPVPRLEVHPQPATSTVNAYVITYRARWQDVSSDQAVIPIPDFLEPFFRDICRLYARSVVENDTIGFSERVATRLQSPDYAAVIYRDGMIQPSYGKIRSGVDESYGPVITFLNPA